MPALVEAAAAMTAASPVRVADTRLALRALASAYRDRFDIPFVQITGT